MADDFDQFLSELEQRRQSEADAEKTRQVDAAQDRERQEYELWKAEKRLRDAGKIVSDKPTQAERATVNTEAWWQERDPNSLTRQDIEAMERRYGPAEAHEKIFQMVKGWYSGRDVKLPR